MEEAVKMWPKRHKEGIVCAVFASPKGGRNSIEGMVTDPNGECYLKVKVTVAPEGGKANAAIIRLLAEAWDVPVSKMVVIRGETSRRKHILIRGDADTLERKLQEWLAAM